MAASGPPGGGSGEGRRYHVVLNAGSGTMAALGGREAAGRIAELFRDAGADAVVEAAEGPEIAAAIDRAIAGPAEVIVVGGGDGTVAAVAQRLLDTPKALGVLPLGTMNLLARDLGCPPDLAEAIVALCRGEIGTIDIAEVNGRALLTASGLGLYPLMVQDRDRQRRQLGRAKWPAMLIAFCRMLWRFPRLRLAIQTAEGTRRVRTSLLFVTNNSYDLASPALFRRTRLDEGRLGLYVSRRRTPLGTLGMILRVIFARSRRLPRLQHSTHEAVTILAPHRHLLVANDGEIERLSPPLVYRIRPGGLRVIRPRSGG